MAKKGKTKEELWVALEGLDDDLLDMDLPEAILDEELGAAGIVPSALAEKGNEFVNRVKEEERLSWQTRARLRRTQLEARASRASVPLDMDRQAMLARLEEVRATHPDVGTTIKMAARKRRPEESTDDELRALLEEMEALRAIESGDLE